MAPGIPGRGSATEAEAQAASYAAEQLAGLGISEVSQQPFRGLRSIWLFLALAFGFALAGHLAFWLLRRPLGMPVAWALSTLFFAFAAYLMWRKFTFRSYPLQSSLPHGASQNVVAYLPPTGETRRQVVLVAHLDSHRAVWWFASDFLVTLYAFLAPIGVYGLVLAPLAYGLAALSGLVSLAWVGLAFAVVHFISWFTGMTADTGPYSPGANDNASAVGTVLSLAQRLGQSPLQQTAVWLTFTGCEETGCDGMVAFLDKYGAQLSNALFLDFELVGIGERLVYLQSEGVVRRKHIPAVVEELMKRTGDAFSLQPVNAARFGAFTETGVAWGRGLQAATLMALRQGTPLLPEWHRMTDAADHLQSETLAKVHGLAWAILQDVDSGGAD